MVKRGASSEERLEDTRGRIRSIDDSWVSRARTRLDSLTKPPGSLGSLEEIAVRVAAIQESERPSLSPKRIIVMAGDHGVVSRGVSPYPAEVTPQMIANFLAGGAAINQLAAWADADVVVVDVGVAAEMPPSRGLVSAKVRAGTRDMTRGQAMTRDEAVEAMLVGADLAQAACDEGVRCIALGEMGIGNTTAASAITAVLTGTAPETVTGPGTGLDPAGVERKAGVVREAIAKNSPDPDDALDVLAKVGGLEVAALAGAVLGSAAAGVCVVADGFICGAAALVAVRYAPASAAYLFPSHVSAEPGHRVVLDALGMSGLLEFDMRLGEGTGAALAMGIMDAACRVMSGMATFAEAGVSDRE